MTTWLLPRGLPGIIEFGQGQNLMRLYGSKSVPFCGLLEIAVLGVDRLRLWTLDKMFHLPKEFASL